MIFSHARKTLGVFFLLCGAMVFVGNAAAKDTLAVKASPFKARRGEKVKILVRGPASGAAVSAVLLKPSSGVSPIVLVPAGGAAGAWEAEVKLDDASPDGLYGIHAWIGDAKNPAGVGKESFLLGN